MLKKNLVLKKHKSQDSFLQRLQKREREVAKAKRSTKTRVAQPITPSTQQRSTLKRSASQPSVQPQPPRTQKRPVAPVTDIVFSSSSSQRRSRHLGQEYTKFLLTTTWEERKAVALPLPEPSPQRKRDTIECQDCGAIHRLPFPVHSGDLPCRLRCKMSTWSDDPEISPGNYKSLKPRKRSRNKSEISEESERKPSPMVSQERTKSQPLPYNANDSTARVPTQPQSTATMHNEEEITGDVDRTISKENAAAAEVETTSETEAESLQVVRSETSSSIQADSMKPEVVRSETSSSIQMSEDKSWSSREITISSDRRVRTVPKNPSTIQTQQLRLIQETQEWVACDCCDKWRLLPVGTKASDLQDKWWCSLWPNLSCSLPEDAMLEQAEGKSTEEALDLTSHPEEKLASTPKPRTPTQKTEQTTKKQFSQKEKKSSLNSGLVVVSCRSCRTNRRLPKCMRPKSLPWNCSLFEGLPCTVPNESWDDLVFYLVQHPNEITTTNAWPNPLIINDRTICGAQKSIKTATAKKKEVVNTAWVACDRCFKWRKLPPDVRSNELPSFWYCSKFEGLSCQVSEDSKVYAEQSIKEEIQRSGDADKKYVAPVVRRPKLQLKRKWDDENIPDGFCVYNSHDGDVARVVSDTTELQILFSEVLRAMDPKPQMNPETKSKKVVKPKPSTASTRSTRSRRSGGDAEIVSLPYRYNGMDWDILGKCWIPQKKVESRVRRRKSSTPNAVLSIASERGGGAPAPRSSRLPSSEATTISAAPKYEIIDSQVVETEIDGESENANILLNGAAEEGPQSDEKSTPHIREHYSIDRVKCRNSDHHMKSLVDGESENATVLLNVAKVGLQSDENRTPRVPEHDSIDRGKCRNLDPNKKSIVDGVSENAFLNGVDEEPQSDENHTPHVPEHDSIDRGECRNLDQNKKSLFSSLTQTCADGKTINEQQLQESQSLVHHGIYIGSIAQTPRDSSNPNYMRRQRLLKWGLLKSLSKPAKRVSVKDGDIAIRAKSSTSDDRQNEPPENQSLPLRKRLHIQAKRVSIEPDSIDTSVVCAVSKENNLRDGPSSCGRTRANAEEADGVLLRCNESLSDSAGAIPPMKSSAFYGYMFNKKRKASDIQQDRVYQVAASPGTRESAGETDEDFLHCYESLHESAGAIPPVKSLAFYAYMFNRKRNASDIQQDCLYEFAAVPEGSKKITEETKNEDENVLFCREVIADTKEVACFSKILASYTQRFLKAQKRGNSQERLKSVGKLGCTPPYYTRKVEAAGDIEGERSVLCNEALACATDVAAPLSMEMLSDSNEPRPSKSVETTSET
jgi:hypothetical protein